MIAQSVSVNLSIELLGKLGTTVLWLEVDKHTHTHTLEMYCNERK